MLPELLLLGVAALPVFAGVLLLSAVELLEEEFFEEELLESGEEELSAEDSLPDEALLGELLPEDSEDSDDSDDSEPPEESSLGMEE